MKKNPLKAMTQVHEDMRNSLTKLQERAEKFKDSLEGHVLQLTLLNAEMLSRLQHQVNGILYAPSDRVIVSPDIDGYEKLAGHGTITKAFTGGVQVVYDEPFATRLGLPVNEAIVPKGWLAHEDYTIEETPL